MAAATAYLTNSLIPRYDFFVLYYVGSGRRDYARKPIPPYRRPYWEFQAILTGAAEPSGLDRSPAERAAQRTAAAPGTAASPRSGISAPLLWLFPPGHLHGWQSASGTECSVAVFHFDRVIEPVSAYVEQQGCLAVPLSTERVAAVNALAAEVRAALRESLPGSAVLYDYVRAWLCYLVWSAAPREIGAGHGTAKSERVHGALSYYREHMHAGVSLGEVAAHVTCSPSHLRRLFHELRGQSPKQAFQQEQMARARELLLLSDRSGESVAEQCGFSSLQAFSRAFRRREGETLRAWRRRRQR